MALGDLMAPATIDAMLRATPGAVAVLYAGVDGWGHFEHVPTDFGPDPGVVASRPSVVVASGFFPGMGLDDGAGEATGVGEDITVGEYVWTISGMEPGLQVGEIRLLLSNRRSP